MREERNHWIGGRPRKRLPQSLFDHALEYDRWFCKMYRRASSDILLTKRAVWAKCPGEKQDAYVCERWSRKVLRVNHGPWKGDHEYVFDKTDLRWKLDSGHTIYYLD